MTPSRHPERRRVPSWRGIIDPRPEPFAGLRTRGRAQSRCAETQPLAANVAEIMRGQCPAAASGTAGTWRSRASGTARPGRSDQFDVRASDLQSGTPLDEVAERIDPPLFTPPIGLIHPNDHTTLVIAPSEPV